MDLIISRKLERVYDIASDPDVQHDKLSAKLTEVYSLLGAPGSKVGSVHPATFVRFAEVALDLGDEEIAHKAVSQFFALDAPLNQFSVRALCVRALLLGRQGAKQHGAAAVDTLHEAQAILLQAMSVSEQLCIGKPTDRIHDYALIYNVSVHHWTVIRPLLRQGMRKHAIPSLSRVTSALRAARDIDVRWIVKNLAALIICHHEQKDTAKALELLAQVEEMVPNSTSDPVFNDDIVRLRQHISAADSTTGDTGKPVRATPGKIVTPSDALPPRTRAWQLLQPVMSQLALQIGSDCYRFLSPPIQQHHVDQHAIRSKLNDVVRLVRPDLLEVAARRAEEASKKTLILSNGAATEQKADDAADTLDILANVAAAACHADAHDLAYICINAVKASKIVSTTATVIVDCTLAELQLKALTVIDTLTDAGLYVDAPQSVLHVLAATQAGPDKQVDRRASYAMAIQASFASARTSEDKVVMLPTGLNATTTPLPQLSPAVIKKILLKRRVAALKQLKNSIVTAASTSSVYLVEYSSSIALNIGLPLLEHPSLADVCRPTFDQATQALRAAGSVNYNLMGRFHALLAHLHMHADMIASALHHIHCVNELDYGTQSTPLTLRPLDLPLLVLEKEIRIARALYADHTDPVDKAFQLLQSANKCDNEAVLLSILERIVSLLSSDSEDIKSSWQKLPASYATISRTDSKPLPSIQASNEQAIITHLLSLARIWLQVAELSLRLANFPFVMMATQAIAGLGGGSLLHRDILQVRVRAGIVRATACARECSRQQETDPVVDAEQAAARGNAELRRRAISAFTAGLWTPTSSRWWEGCAHEVSASRVANSFERWGLGPEPGSHDIPSRTTALGIISPGCSPSHYRLKCLVITSLAEAAQQAVLLGSVSALESVARRFWNAHCHVWADNSYGPSVMPLLIDGVLEILRGLLVLGSTHSALLVKLALIYCRYQEERGTQLHVIERFAVPATSGFHLPDGAALWSAADLLEAGTQETQDSVALYAKAFDAQVLSALNRPIIAAQLHLRKALAVSSFILAINPGIIRDFHKLDIMLLRSRVRLALLTMNSVSSPPVVEASKDPKKAAPAEQKPGVLLESLCKLDDVENDWVTYLPHFGRVAACFAMMCHRTIDRSEKLSSLRNGIAAIAACAKELNDGLERGKTDDGGHVPAAKAVPPKNAAKPAAKVAAMSESSPDPFHDVRFESAEQDASAFTQMYASVTADQKPAAFHHATAQELQDGIRNVTCFFWSRFAAAGVQLSIIPAGVDTGLLVDAQKSAALAVRLLPVTALARAEAMQVFGTKGHTPGDFGFSDAHGLFTLSWESRFAGNLDGAVVASADEGGDLSLAKSLWLAEMAWSQAAVLAVDSSKQALSEVQAVMAAAVLHIAAAARVASTIRDASLLRQTGTVMLHIACKAALDPRILQEGASCIIEGMLSMRMHTSADQKIVAGLGYQLLQALIALEQWDEGSVLCAKIFSSLEPSYLVPLWSLRLHLESKLGRDVTLSVNGMKKDDPLLRYRLWLSIARMARTRADQQHAYLEALLASDGHAHRGYVLLDMAEWMYRCGDNGCAIADLLNEACNYLLSVEPGQDANDQLYDAASVAKSTNTKAKTVMSKAKSVRSRVAAPTVPSLPQGGPSVATMEGMMRVSALHSLCAGSASDTVAHLRALTVHAMQLWAKAGVYANDIVRLSASDECSGPIVLPTRITDWLPAVEDFAKHDFLHIMDSIFNKHTMLLREARSEISKVLVASRGQAKVLLSELRDADALVKCLCQALDRMESLGMHAEQGVVLTLVLLLCSMGGFTLALSAECCRMISWLSRVLPRLAEDIADRILHLIYPTALAALRAFAQSDNDSATSPATFSQIIPHAKSLANWLLAKGLNALIEPLAPLMIAIASEAGDHDLEVIAKVCEFQANADRGIACAKEFIQRVGHIRNVHIETLPTILTCICRWAVRSNLMKDAQVIVEQVVLVAEVALCRSRKRSVAAVDHALVLSDICGLKADCLIRSALQLRRAGFPWQDEFTQAVNSACKACDILDDMSFPSTLRALALQRRAQIYRSASFPILHDSACAPNDALRASHLQLAWQDARQALTLSQLDTEHTLHGHLLRELCRFASQCSMETLLRRIKYRSGENERLEQELINDPVAKYLYVTGLQTMEIPVYDDSGECRAIVSTMEHSAHLESGQVSALLRAQVLWAHCFEAALNEHMQEGGLFSCAHAWRRVMELVWTPAKWQPLDAEVKVITEDVSSKTLAAAKDKKGSAAKATDVPKVKMGSAKSKSDPGVASPSDPLADFLSQTAPKTPPVSLLDIANPEAAVPGNVIDDLLQSCTDACKSALNDLLPLGDYGNARSAAYMLLNCYGTRNPVRATIVLALWQALCAREHLLETLMHSSAHNKQFQHFCRSHAIHVDGTVHTSQTIARSADLESLQQWLPYRLLECNIPMQHVLFHMPVSTKVLILQLSPDWSELYVGLLVRSKAPEGEPLGNEAHMGTPEGDLPGLTASIQRCDLSEADVQDLIMIMKQSDDIYDASWGITKAMSEDRGAEADLAELPKATTTAIRRTSAAAAMGDTLEISLQQLLFRMDEFISRVTSVAEGEVSVLRGLDNELPAAVMSCKELSSLPWEGWSALKRSSSIHRDFSLYFAAQRAKLAEQRPGSVDFVTDLKFWNQPVSPEYLDAAISSVTYMADPLADGDTGAEPFTAICGSVLPNIVPPDATKRTDAKKALAAETEVELTDDSASIQLASVLAAGLPDWSTCRRVMGSWFGLQGNAGVIASSGFQTLLRMPSLKPVQKVDSTMTLAGGVFVFMAHGRMFVDIQPDTVLGLPTPSCRVALILDSSSNNTSARRMAQARQQQTANFRQVSAERAWDAAAILSLNGVGAVIVHQWASTKSVNSNLLYSLTQFALRKNGGSIAQWLAAALRPQRQVSEVKLKDRVAYNTVLYGLPTNVYQ